MITLTDSARRAIADFVRGRKPGTLDPIRVYPRKDNAGGVQLALALDRIQEELDEVEETGGFTFCMNKDLKRMVHHVTVDMGSTGLVCTSLIPLPKMAAKGCSASCGGNCSSCR